MAIRKRGKNDERASRPTHSSLGSRIEQLLRLAEEQRDQIITDARHEAARIVDEARRQAEQILANARLQAGQLADGTVTEPGAGQDSGSEAGAKG